MAGGMGRGGQVASFEALTQGDDLEANNPAPNGLALGNEQALCAYADRAVSVTQQAGGEAHTTGRDGRLFFFSSRRRHTRFLPVSWARTTGCTSVSTRSTSPRPRRALG